MSFVAQFSDTIQRVNHWATQNALDDYQYGSRQSYWALALNQKVITRQEYDYAATYYGTLWTYRGD